MKTITALCIGLVFAGLACVAQALTPAQRVVLFNGCLPTFVCQQYGPAGQLPDVAVDCPQNLGYVRGSYNGTASGLIGVTNASGGYVDDLANNWALIAPNTLRRSDKWCLFEEARTNGIRNNSMQGAVAGSPGTRPTNWPAMTLAGLSTTIVGIGVQNGVDYIDIRFNGTTNAAQVQVLFETSTQIAALISQVWTTSAFLSIVGGDLTNVTSVRLRVQERDNVGGLLVSTDTVAAPTAALTRFSGTVTLGNAATAFITPGINLLVTNLAAVDITLRIGWPGLEFGAWASSPIRTTSAAVTRNADQTSLSTGINAIFAQWLNPTEGTLFYMGQQITGAAQGRAVNISDGTINQQTRLLISANINGQVIDGGVAQFNQSVAITQYGPVKGAMRYRANDFIAAANGTLSTADPLGTVPAGLSAITFGNNLNTSQFANIGLQRFGYWRTGLPNANVQAITQ